MPRLTKLVAAFLALSLAAEPALAGGGFTEGPAKGAEAGAHPISIVPAGGIQRVDLKTTNLDPLGGRGLELPSGVNVEGAAVNPAQAVLPGNPQPGAVLPAAEIQSSAPQASDPEPPAQPQGSGLRETNPAKGSFGDVAKEGRGELEEKVWTDAEGHGFQRKAEGADVAGAESSPAALAQNSQTPPQGPKSPPAPAKKEQLSVFSGKVLGFFSTFLMVQLAVESLALAVPQMADPLKNGFIALAGLASTSYLAYAIGSFLGGRFVQKFGLARVYRLVLSSRVLIWGAVAAIFHAHHGVMPIAPLIGLFSVDYFVHSMGRVAERTLQGEWFKDSPAASNKFGTMRDFVEYGTVFTTMGTGLVIATMGYGAIIYAAPVMFAIAAALAIGLRSLPQKITQVARKVALFAGFKRLFSPGMKPIWLSRLLINNFVYLLYYVTGTAFGVFFGHGNVGLAAAASSALIGLLGMGANMAALTNARISTRIEAETKNLPEGEQGPAQAKLMSASAAKAMKWAALAMLGGWTFISHASLGTVAAPLIFAAPILGAAGVIGLVVKTILTMRKDKAGVWSALKKSWLWALMTIGGFAFVALKTHLAPYLIWPLFLVSPALVLIGYTGQVALTQLDTLLLDKMPKRTKAYVVGADRALTNLSYVVNFLIWGVLFQLFGPAAFIGLGVYCTLTAAAYLFLSRRVAPPAK